MKQFSSLPIINGRAVLVAAIGSFAVGVALGTAMDNMGAGIAIGIAIGAAMGAGQGKSKPDADQTDQDESDGAP